MEANDVENVIALICFYCEDGTTRHAFFRLHFIDEGVSNSHNFSKASILIVQVILFNVIFTLKFGVSIDKCFRKVADISNLHRDLGRNERS
jgi:hypothetical protein